MPRALGDDLSGGQGGDVALQARHGPVHAGKKRRGEAVGKAQTVGDQAQQADEDGFQAAGEFKPNLRIPLAGDRGAGPGRRGMGYVVHDMFLRRFGKRCKRFFKIFSNRCGFPTVQMPVELFR